MKKLIALDLDGTLLTSDLKISKNTENLLKELASKGMYIVIATGRPYVAAKAFAQKLGLNHPLIVHNGAQVIDFDGRTYYIKPVLNETAKTFIKFCENNNYTCSVFFEDSIYMNKEDHLTRQVHEKLNMTVPKVNKNLEGLLFKNPFIKLLVTAQPYQIPDIYEKLKKMFGDSLNIARSGEAFIDIMDKNVSKGKALVALAEKLGINREDTIAIGDNHNDLDMISMAGIGVAMANADDTVKQKADYVTLSNDEDGIAHILKKIL